MKRSSNIEEIKEFDTVLLKDGREADIMEAFENKVFIADVGSCRLGDDRSNH